MTTSLTLLNDIATILTLIRPEYDFKNSNDFVVDGLIDSFDLIELTLHLEKKFVFKIPGSEVHPDNFRSYAAIMQLVNRYKK
jgi:acyl carrier protein